MDPTQSIATLNSPTPLPSENAKALLLNIPEASALVGLTPWQLRALISDNELNVIRVGKKLYLRRASLIRWAERAEQKYRARPRSKKAKQQRVSESREVAA